MARRVFFSFHYQRDVWRVSQVRNSWVANRGSTTPFLDAAAWESVKRGGDASIKKWIDLQLSGTGVTVVLIGTHTHERKYVRYEIEQSRRRGNGLLGVYIHRIRDQDGATSRKGKNPLSRFKVKVEPEWWDPLNFFGTGGTRSLADIYHTHDWVSDNGRENLGGWIEEAAKMAGR